MAGWAGGAVEKCKPVSALPSLRLRIARHAMEGRALAGELRSFVAAEEVRQGDLTARALRLDADGQDDEAEALNDEADALDGRLDALRDLRDALNEAADGVTFEIAALDACGEERKADAPRH